MEENKRKFLYIIIIPILTSIIGGILVFEFYQSELGFNDLVTWLLILLLGLSGFTVYLISKHNSYTISEFKNTEESFVTLQNSFNELLSKVTSVNWSSDLEEHDTNVYNKMIELVDDYSISGMDVFSIFRQEDYPKGKGKEVINNYYRAIENAIRGRGFRYRRAIVVREELRRNKVGKSKSKLFKNRPEFYKHWETVNNNFNSSKAEIKAFFDEGRIIDVAFALFYEDNVYNGNISTLVLEISVMNIQTENPIMGLLIINKPDRELVKAFRNAFEGVFDEKLNIKSFSYENIWN